MAKWQRNELMIFWAFIWQIQHITSYCFASPLLHLSLFSSSIFSFFFRVDVAHSMAALSLQINLIRYRFNRSFSRISKWIRKKKKKNEWKTVCVNQKIKMEARNGGIKKEEDWKPNWMKLRAAAHLLQMYYVRCEHICWRVVRLRQINYNSNAQTISIRSETIRFEMCTTEFWDFKPWKKELEEWNWKYARVKTICNWCQVSFAFAQRKATGADANCSIVSSTFNEHIIVVIESCVIIQRKQIITKNAGTCCIQLVSEN